jgi:hypothetical protein
VIASTLPPTNGRSVPDQKQPNTTTVKGDTSQVFPCPTYCKNTQVSCPELHLVSRTSLCFTNIENKNVPEQCLPADINSCDKNSILDTLASEVRSKCNINGTATFNQPSDLDTDYRKRTECGVGYQNEDPTGGTGASGGADANASVGTGASGGADANASANASVVPGDSGGANAPVVPGASGSANAPVVPGASGSANADDSGGTPQSSSSKMAAPHTWALGLVTSTVLSLVGKRPTN